MESYGSPTEFDQSDGSPIESDGSPISPIGIRRVRSDYGGEGKVLQNLMLTMHIPPWPC
jgi:hypothetical protein